MTTIYKFFLFLIIFSAALAGGYYLYRYMNKKIKASETGWQLLGYSVLLILLYGLMFFTGLFILIYGYEWLSGVETN